MSTSAEHRTPDQATARVLARHNQQLGVLARLTPGPHHQAAKQASRVQVGDRKDHPAMVFNLAGRRGEIE